MSDEVLTEPAIIYVKCGLCGDTTKVYVHIDATELGDNSQQFVVTMSDVDTQETYDHHFNKHMDLGSLGEEGDWGDEFL